MKEQRNNKLLWVVCVVDNLFCICYSYIILNETRRNVMRIKGSKNKSYTVVLRNTSRILGDGFEFNKLNELLGVRISFYKLLESCPFEEYEHYYTLTLLDDSYVMFTYEGRQLYERCLNNIHFREKMNIDHDHDDFFVEKTIRQFIAKQKALVFERTKDVRRVLEILAKGAEEEEEAEEEEAEEEEV